MSKQGRAWYAKASQDLVAQKWLPISGAVIIGVELAAPTKRAYDPDNKTKVLFDALVKAGVIEDDSNRIIRMHWVDSRGEGFQGAKVTIWSIPDEESDSREGTRAITGSRNYPEGLAWWQAYQDGLALQRTKQVPLLPVHAERSPGGEE